MTKFESDVAREIVSIGLAKAADSMSFFMKDRVLIQDFDIEDRFNELDAEPEEGFTVLTTDLKGELDGVCHLVLKDAEAKKLVDISLPEEMKQDEEKYKMMSGATLLEADNIISASMITQFSNLLGFQMYGDVPRMENLNGSELNNFLKESIKPTYCVMQFNATFGTKDEGFNPIFLWFISCDFMEGVKNFSENDENLKKLKEIKLK